MREEIFRTPVEPLDCLTFQPLGKIFRQRPTQVAAMRFDFGKARPLHHRQKSPANGLYFRQFGHE